MPATYGYTGSDINSTISSLSKNNAHTSDVRKARTADGLLLFQDKNGDGNGVQKNNKNEWVEDPGEPILYTQYQEVLALGTKVYIGTYSGYGNSSDGKPTSGPHSIYEANADGKKFLYVDRNNNGRYDESAYEKLFMMYESNYGQGYLNFDTVYGNNITYVENDKSYTTVSDDKIYFLNSINGRITPPELIGSGTTKSKQYMNLTCTGNQERYMLWNIRASYSTNKNVLSANSYFQYSDHSAYGGSKPYVTWSNESYVENKNYLEGNQCFFIFYSMNADGGYYLGPLDFSYGSTERENFRVIEIPAYNTPEMLTVADYNYGSNARFKISAKKIEKTPALELNDSSSLTRVENELYKVSAGQTASDVISNFKNENAVVKNANGEIIDSTANVGTGYTIELVEDGEKVDFVTVIILGDVSGDGNVNVTDYVKIKAALQNTETLSGAYEKASDIDGSGELDVTDYLKVKAHFLGDYNIYA
jgi:hypothetical protein